MANRVASCLVLLSLLGTPACGDDDTGGPDAAGTDAGGTDAGGTDDGGADASRPDAGGGTDGSTGRDGAIASGIAIPGPAEWTDRGEVLTAGSAGDWDLYLWGGFAVSALKRDGTYYLYYQGSDGYDDVEDTVTHRAIGLATSDDGISFTEHTANPVLTWLPTSSNEEGAASGGAFVTPSGGIGIVYGANTQINPAEVNADGRFADSADGVAFTDRGVVIDHADGRVFGSGDELFPVLALPAPSRFITYYIPNGSPQRGELGVAWGDGPLDITSTSGVRAGGAAVGAWGPASAARLAPGRWAVFVNNVADGHASDDHIDVYEVDPADPAAFVGPLQTYAPSDFSRGVVLLDESTDTWFLYHRTDPADAYRVMTAPVRRR